MSITRLPISSPRGQVVEFLSDLSIPHTDWSDKTVLLSNGLANSVPLHDQIRDAAGALAWMTDCRTANQAAQVQQQFDRLLALAERVKPMERFCNEIARECAEQERLQAAAERRRAAIATGRVVELAAHRQPHRAWSGHGGAA